MSDPTTKVVCVTHSYETLGNIDMEAYDLLKMPETNPYRVVVEKALKNAFRVARLDLPEECWESTHPVYKELAAAKVKLPAFVVAHVHLLVSD
jgi:hypothetical protein